MSHGCRCTDNRICNRLAGDALNPYWDYVLFLYYSYVVAKVSSSAFLDPDPHLCWVGGCQLKEGDDGLAVKECDIAQTQDGIKIVRAFDFLLGE